MNDEWEVFIPEFPGFYCSIYDDEMNAVFEQEVENYLDAHPEADKDTVYEQAWNHADWSEATRELCQRHAGIFTHHLAVSLGISGTKYPIPYEMSSPREYNFTTDRLLIKLPQHWFELVLARIDRQTLADVVRERHSSYAGFISFYSNDVDEWGPLDTWDYNQLQTLLYAWTRVSEYWEDLDVTMEVIENAPLWGIVDFDKVDEALKESASE